MRRQAHDISDRAQRRCSSLRAALPVAELGQRLFARQDPKLVLR